MLFARFFVFILFSGVIWAQVTGRLTGTVVDSTGAAVSGASVQLKINDGTAVAAQSTTAEGLFSFASLQPGIYEVQVESTGFAPVHMTNVKIDTARETTITAITLQPATVTQSVEVTAGLNAVQTSNAEVATTVTNEQIRRLPQLDRNILALISTQPGVGSNNRTATTINGLRVSYANITLDGVNIQDNLFRENSLDFQPNLLLIDQVGELSMVTSNSNTSTGYGATQVAFSTPSGTNELHGAAYWYNRNNALAANGFFANMDGIGLARLNQNQAGARLGGAIVKNKLFFYTNYEAFRRRQQAQQSRTILTDTARQGIFTYVGQNGAVMQRNVLQLAGRSIDPYIASLLDQTPGGSEINHHRLGDSIETLLKNTAGYSFLARDNRDRDNVLGKLDYYINDKHSLFGTYAWNRSLLDRPNQYGYSVEPTVANDNAINLAAVGWRSTWSPTFTNELRFGFNLAPADFVRTAQAPSYFVTGLLFSDPVQEFMPEGRKTDTYNLSNNANWVKGRHTMSFGFQMQRIKSNAYSFDSIVPTYTIGIASTVPGLNQADFPGISAADFETANSLLATLAGMLESGTQRFNVADRASGFVPGAERRRIWTLNNYAGYFQDNWKIHRRLSLTAGLRYEYVTPVDETRGLALLPVTNGRSAIDTLLSDSTLGFAGNAAGRAFYNPDHNNFAPNIGLAWDVFGDGKTSLRAGYSVNFVNDNQIATLENIAKTNDGLQSDVTMVNLTQTVANRPAIRTPEFQVPRTFSENYDLNPFDTAFAMADPNLRTPYVQQWNFGIQRQLGGGVLEARYIGNRAAKQYRAFDYNQIMINAGGFLADFKRAYSNGVLALQSNGVFDPRYNAAIPGSQQLPVFSSLPGGGLLTNAGVRNFIRQQEVAELANTYQYSGLNGSIDFFRNPFALGTNMLTNYSMSSYHALQLDYTRRFAHGVSWQANYVFGKSLSDSLGDSQVNFEPFLDINNTAIEKSRTPFDLRHAFKSNFVADLPFGRGRRYANGGGALVSHLVSGWSVSGITTWQSGFPFSITSERATLNRGGVRSLDNTANTNLTGFGGLVGYYMTGNGPYIVGQPAINPQDGRGVQSDGRAPFQGQIFFNPNAGEIGALGRRVFSGPQYFNFDFGIQKQIRITERQSAELRMESINLFNNAFFDTMQEASRADYNINSTTFGRIVNQSNAPRVIQFGLYYRF